MFDVIKDLEIGKMFIIRSLEEGFGSGPIMVDEEKVYEGIVVKDGIEFNKFGNSYYEVNSPSTWYLLRFDV